ncbi:hypothetical protein HY631_01650 [Candidatus Uhrbacteria bacterium]|nr:hypothetical protein [Candidatus Uhrbacteria bacterium]
MDEQTTCGSCKMTEGQSHDDQNCEDCKGGGCTCEMGCCQEPRPEEAPAA